MGGVADVVTGKGAKKQRQLAIAAQNDQAARLAEEKARVDEIERGQRAATKRGGVGGLLAFVDDNVRGTFGT